ncbi:MAG: hypothetical protein WBF33_25610 [Candidatus Nitrosopolaris sp.]
MDILLKDKGLEEELVPWEDEVLEFIRCCCATAVDGSNPLNGNVIIIATAKQQLLQLQIGFSLGGRVRIIHQIYFYA